MPCKPDKTLSYYEPKTAERNVVRNLVMSGCTQRQIADVMEISLSSVKKHFAQEIRAGARVANADVVGWLYDSCRKGNVQAQIFWCKTRLGWREVDRLELAGPDGQNLFQGIIDVTPISGEDWIKEYGRDSIDATIGGDPGGAGIETTNGAAPDQGRLEASNWSAESSS